MIFAVMALSASMMRRAHPPNAHVAFLEVGAMNRITRWPQIFSSITAYVAAAPATRIRFSRALAPATRLTSREGTPSVSGDQLGQRRVGFALARRRAHTHLQHTASIRQLFDAVDRVTPAARRKPHREHEPVRLDPPGRSSRAHSAER
jgi:hypothetical protein